MLPWLEGTCTLLQCPIMRVEASMVMLWVGEAGGVKSGFGIAGWTVLVACAVEVLLLEARRERR